MSGKYNSFDDESDDDFSLGANIHPKKSRKS